MPAAQYVLPADLDRCGLLSCLSPSQFADALTEAIHAGTPGGARADRAVDVRVLEQLTAALGGWITPARLAAAAQAALGHPVPPGLLTAQEEALIGGDLFPAGLPAADRPEPGPPRRVPGRPGPVRRAHPAQPASPRRPTTPAWPWTPGPAAPAPRC